MIDALRNGALIVIRTSAGSATGRVTSGAGPEAVRQAVNQENYRGRNDSDCAAARRPPGNMAGQAETDQQQR